MSAPASRSFCRFLAGAWHHAAVILLAPALPWRWVLLPEPMQASLKNKMLPGQRCQSCRCICYGSGLHPEGPEASVQSWQHAPLLAALAGFAPGHLKPSEQPSARRRCEAGCVRRLTSPVSTSNQCAHGRTPGAQAELFTTEPFYPHRCLPVKP